MREIRLHGSEGGGTEINRFSLPHIKCNTGVFGWSLRNSYVLALKERQAPYTLCRRWCAGERHAVQEGRTARSGGKRK